MRPGMARSKLAGSVFHSLRARCLADDMRVAAMRVRATALRRGDGAGNLALDGKVSAVCLVDNVPSADGDKGGGGMDQELWRR